MSTDKIDSNKKPTEVSAKDAKTELTEEELAKVSGGTIDKASVKFFQNCASGAHYKTVTLAM
jgi:bacteriocin-like protein